MKFNNKNFFLGVVFLICVSCDSSVPQKKLGKYSCHQDNVPVYLFPWSKSILVLRVSFGGIVDVIAAKGGRFKIKYKNRSGWVAKRFFTSYDLSAGYSSEKNDYCGNVIFYYKNKMIGGYPITKKKDGKEHQVIQLDGSDVYKYAEHAYYRFKRKWYILRHDILPDEFDRVRVTKKASISLYTNKIIVRDISEEDGFVIYHKGYKIFHNLFVRYRPGYKPKFSKYGWLLVFSEKNNKLLYKKEMKVLFYSANFPVEYLNITEPILTPAFKKAILKLVKKRGNLVQLIGLKKTINMDLKNLKVTVQ